MKLLPKSLVTLAACVCVVSSPATSAPSAATRAPGDGLVSSGLRPRVAPQPAAGAGGSRAALSAFVNRYGGTWDAQHDLRVDRVHLVWGSGIPIVPGRGNTLTTPTDPTFGDVERSIRKVLHDSIDLHGVSDSDLVVASARSGNRHDARVWLVDFDRVVGGVPVVGSRIFARVGDGNCTQLGFERLFPIDPALAVPSLPGPDARRVVETAVGLIDSQPATPETLLLWPTTAPGSGYDVVLVWQVNVRSTIEGKAWTGLVDARSGALLELWDARRATSGQVTGDVHPRLATDGEIVAPFPNLKVRDGASLVTTNWSGLYNSPDVGPVTFTLTGLTPPGGFNVVNQSGGSASVTVSAGPSNVDHRWDSTNSTAAERNAFYHLHKVRALALSHGVIPWLETAVTARVGDATGVCNALWDGAELRFFAEGGGCLNAAEIADVVAHEWGHGLSSAQGGQHDDASKEAISDITAWLLTRSPLYAASLLEFDAPPFLGALDDHTALRDASKLVAINNIDQRCPTNTAGSCTGPLGKECHCEGLILSGATWDLLELLRAQWGAFLAYDIVEEMHFGSIPTWNDYRNTADAFVFFDDDNGNLADGTPNACLIYKAFDRHGIAPISALPCSVQAARLDLSDRAVFELQGDDDGFAEPGESIQIQLEVNNSGNATALTAVATVSSNNPLFVVTNGTATFPPISATTTASSNAPHIGVDIDPAVACGTRAIFDVSLTSWISSFDGGLSIEVGEPVAVLFEDGFDSATTDWILDGGNALEGDWRLGSPSITANDGDIYQPGAPAAGSGCLFTGDNPSWDRVSLGDVDFGTVIAESPPLDLAWIGTPVLQFDYWFVSAFVKSQTSDIFEVEVLNGPNLQTVFIETVSASAWRSASVPLPNLDPTADIVLRFKATDEGTPGNGATYNTVEAAIDDVRIVDYDCSPGCTLGATIDALGPTDICYGNATALTVDVPGCPTGATYQWLLEGVPIAGADDPTLDIPATQAPGIYRYDVEVDCPGRTCEQTVGPVVVSITRVEALVTSLPTISLCHDDSTIVDGSASTVEGCAGTPLYSWWLSGTQIAGANGPTLVLEDVGPGQFELVLKVGCDSTPNCYDASLPIGVHVVELVAAVVDPGPVRACRGDSLVIDSTPSVIENCTASAYAWRRNGNLLPNEVDPALFIVVQQIGSDVFELELTCENDTTCPPSRVAVAVQTLDSQPPPVLDNSLALTTIGSSLQLTWSSTQQGSWNIHSLADKTQLPQGWGTTPIAFSLDTTWIGSGAAVPGTALELYQVYGSDCSGTSFP